MADDKRFIDYNLSKITMLIIRLLTRLDKQTSLTASRDPSNRPMRLIHQKPKQMEGNPSVGSKGNHAHFVLLSCYLIVR